MQLFPHGMALVFFLFAALPLSTGFSGDTPTEKPEQFQATSSQPRPPLQRSSGGRRPRLVFRDRIEPHWIAGNTRFWYRNDLADGEREFVLVNAEQGTREPAFDHAAVASALEADSSLQQQPIESLEYDDTGKLIALVGEDKRYLWDPQTQTITKTETIAETSDAGDERGRERRRRWGNRSRGEVVSPDGKWKATVEDYNIVLLPNASEEAEPNEGEGERGAADNGGANQDGLADGKIVLSTDGQEGFAYRSLQWSPDSKTLVAFRTREVERKLVHLIRSSPEDGGRAQLESRPYVLPGDPLPTYEVNIFHVENREQLKPDVDPFEHEWLRPRVRFSQDGQRFSYRQVDRGHQRLRVIEFEVKTGAVRNIVDERSETFIWTAHTENLDLSLVNWLDETEEIIYATEKNGWRQLILIDAKSGEEVRELTPRGIVVRGIERIDEQTRQVWFKAGGRAGQDPYFVHFGRVDLDTGDLTWLTEGNGTHAIEFSPDRRWLIDRYSRVDMGPVHELRRAEDGQLVCRLEEADLSRLESTGWKPPEVFVAKGRDGKTDIWGIICRPRDYDPSRKYPVIEDIYAGPQSSFVPKRFSSYERYRRLNQLGFIVVKIDGMGTANRSKAFHDVCWHNLKDGGFPDRILWMQAAAEKYPEMDLSRVGIYGGSAGGQNAAAALLFHPDFYKVGVASCGCHDNRMDKASWNEQWMGYPVGPQYSECSNIDNADRLQGRLMLIVGEMDTNVPPESTLRFADALIRADKDFDLVLVPNAGHGRGGAYGTRRMHDFFVEHLLGQPVTNRNGDQSAVLAAFSDTSQADDPTQEEENAQADDAKSEGTIAATIDADANIEAEANTDSEKDKYQNEKQETSHDEGETSAAEPPDLSELSIIEPPEDFFLLVDERDRIAARGFYKKYLDIEGLPVVAAAEVADEALRRTYDIVRHMLAGRSDILQAMHESGMYLIIIGKDQLYTDMPEYRNHPNPDFMNERVRGTGGKPTSFGEENLLGLALDRYDDESIGVHEFCHTIDRTLRRIDPDWSDRLRQTYRAAKRQELYRGAYAGSNSGEYWAEICQSYFDCNRVNNYNHGPVGTREQLKSYDPAGYELVRATLNLSPDQDWRYHFPRNMPQVESPPAKLKIDPYYTKFCLARELTVVGRDASDQAMLRANDIVRKMFAYRHDILKAFIEEGVRLVVLGRDESLSDLPELQSLESESQIDLLGRYLEYSPEHKLLVVGEENLLADPRDPGVGSSHLVRLLAGTIHQLTGTRPVDPEWESRPRGVWQQYELHLERLDERFDQQLEQLYNDAMEAGRWQGTGAVHDHAAYWVSGVLAYFDAAGQEATPTDSPRSIVTREQLVEYDPALHELVRKTMAFDGRVDWRLP